MKSETCVRVVCVAGDVGHSPGRQSRSPARGLHQPSGDVLVAESNRPPMPESATDGGAGLTFSDACGMPAAFANGVFVGEHGS